MSMQEQITSKLNEAFAPDHLEVIDESEQHRGHGGWREGGETHFQVVMTSAAFSSMNRINRQRAVNKVLAVELNSTVHALSMALSAPDD
ncbi:BolA family transcriptional regulator [Rhodobacteraceae bacterium NNCM2]|nr:BolA family transcriptional regulator [Coraliihabitans acroporae]